MIGKIDDLDTILALNTLDEIAITLSIQEYGKLEKIVAGCEKSGVHTKFIPDYYNFIPTRPFMEDLQGLPVIHIRHVPLTNLLKRNDEADDGSGRRHDGAHPVFTGDAGDGDSYKGDFAGTGHFLSGAGGTSQ